MSGLWAVIRKEWKTYFITPAAYVVLALFALVSAFFFYNMLAAFIMRGMAGAGFGGGPLNVNQSVIQPLTFDVGITLLFLLPMLTMRSYAEELRSGTLELLKTAPVRRLDIILGKFLAAAGLLVVLLIMVGIYIGVLAHYGQPDLRAAAVSLLGLLLLGGAFLSIGMLISSLTRSQVVAGVITFMLFLVLWIADWPVAYSDSRGAHIIGYLSVTSHLQTFTQGIVDLKDVIFYLSLILAGLFLTARRMELAE